MKSSNTFCLPHLIKVFNYVIFRFFCINAKMMKFTHCVCFEYTNIKCIICKNDFVLYYHCLITLKRTFFPVWISSTYLNKILMSFHEISLLGTKGSIQTLVRFETNSRISMWKVPLREITWNGHQRISFYIKEYLYLYSSRICFCLK